MRQVTKFKRFGQVLSVLQLSFAVFCPMKNTFTNQFTFPQLLVYSFKSGNFLFDP